MGGVLFFAPRMRTITLLLLLHGLAMDLSCQSISGALPRESGMPSRQIVLYRLRGQERIPLDSARIDRKGRFDFKKKDFPLGYYRLGFDEDQVDIILNPSEPRVVLSFSALPLQSGITVSASDENQRLWEYKWASRDAQELIRRIEGQRKAIDPRDIESLMRLAREEEDVNMRLQATLERLIAHAPASYFAKVARMDRRVMGALPLGPQAIRDSMDWQDPSLTRCSVYAKAIMAILQAATPADPRTLAAASDSILAWAAPDTASWSFARWQLIDLYATYGPEETLQHLVDRYITGPQALVPPEAELLATVAVQLKAAIGSMAPDVTLPSPITGSSDELNQLIQPYPCTVLFFYSSTCDHCHEQMPLLNELHERYNHRGLNIIGIAIDDDESEFRANLAERSLKFPCYSELRGWGSPAAKAFAVRATPWLIAINRDGRIVAKPSNAAELTDLLPSLLP